MDGHNGRRALCNQRLDLRHIHGVVIRVDITEYRLQAVAHNRVRRRGKGERRRDDLARKIQCLQREFECHVPVRKELDLRRTEKIPQGCLKVLMLCAHIGQPSRLPYIANLRDVLLHRRHR